MAKTRSQALSPAVKKEESEDETKLKQLLRDTNNTSKSKSKITKNRKPIQAQITKVKTENADDNKALLASPKKTLIRSKVTKEQVTKLIGYLVNDKLSIKAAAKKVGINEKTAWRYYQDYKNDPEHKIPLPKTQLNNRSSVRLTQEKIEEVIHYIVKDKMTIYRASHKAGISRDAATRYYRKYLEDPERKIPLIAVCTGHSPKACTQEKVNDLIGYIVRDKMTVVEASKKVNMSRNAAKKYYLKYLHDPNHDIPDPSESQMRAGKRCTNEQVKSLIGYIVNDKMTLLEASVKTNMGADAARKYYKQYLDDPENNIPTPQTSNKRGSNNTPTVDQVKNFFCYVIIDKLKVRQAASKAKISLSSGLMYYNTHLKSFNNQTKNKDMSYSVEKMKRLVELVQNEKMSLKKAADAVDLSYSSASKQYQQYLKNPQQGFPENRYQQYTQEDIKKLIDYIEHEKMSVCSAARTIKMNSTTALRYYKKYQDDPEHKIPAPMFNGQAKKNKTLDKYAQIIADIYKNNPSIKPIYGNSDPELNESDINAK